MASIKLSDEFAKQLKDAGFPQKADGAECFDDFGTRISIPTLEELIEACAGEFLGLLPHDDATGWTALKEGDMLFDSHSEGATPTEAVARLWLDLQKK